MKKYRQFLKIFVIFILVLSGYLNQEKIMDSAQNLILTPSSNFDFKNFDVKLNLNENLSQDITIEFCPSIDCLNIYIDSFEKAKSEIKCAFFEFDEDNLANVLIKKSNQNINISLIIDDKYLEEKPLLKLSNSNINIFSDINRNTKYNNFMHNKFCIIDKKIIITGSTNPTNNGFYKNNNNIIKINSKYLAKNYLNEFNQMNSNKFGTNKKSILEYNNISLNFENESYLISSYFCPQDNCEKEILKVLNKSKFEILFASFVLTSNPIENLLVLKSRQNIKVVGIVEMKNRNSKGSKIKELNKSFKVFLDKNKNNMHHKFFVVDEKYLITGSMNPSKNGNKYNDENILIIENTKLAKLYKNEFLKMIK